jgi:hypothetical protein
MVFGDSHQFLLNQSLDFRDLYLDIHCIFDHLNLVHWHYISLPVLHCDKVGNWNQFFNDMFDYFLHFHYLRSPSEHTEDILDINYIDNLLFDHIDYPLINLWLDTRFDLYFLELFEKSFDQYSQMVLHSSAFLGA